MMVYANGKKKVRVMTGNDLKKVNSANNYKKIREYFDRFEKEFEEDPIAFRKKYCDIPVGDNNKFKGSEFFCDKEIMEKHNSKVIDDEKYYAWKFLFFKFKDLTEYSLAMYVFGDLSIWKRFKRSSKALRVFLTHWKLELETQLKAEALRHVLKKASKDFSAAKYILEGKYRDFILKEMKKVVTNPKDENYYFEVSHNHLNKEAVKEAVSDSEITDFINNLLQQNVEDKSVGNEEKESEK